MTLAIRQLEVPRYQRHIPQGQTITIIAKIADVGIVDELVNPVYTPLITIYNPTGSILVNDVVMTNISTGVWSYQYQTTMSSPVGIYTASVKAINADNVAISERRSVFKVVSTTTLASFTHFAIKDQSGVVWYWYITNDNVLNWLPTIPSFLGKQAVLIAQDTIPSWLEVNNPTPSLRYIYPDVTGEALVSASQPAVGSGRSGSPTIISISGGSYTIALNISDEIILTLV